MTALLNAALEPAECRRELVALEEKVAGAGIDEAVAVGLEHHDVVRALVRPMQDAVLGVGLVDHLLGDVDDLVHRQVARQRPLRHRLDERVVIAGLAQELLVVEEHARLGVLRYPVGAVGALRRFPERREDRAEMLGIFGDVVVEFEHEAFRLEGADPFVRGDEHVRPLADTEDLEELQRVVVETLGRAFAHHHLDALVGALGLERLVQPLGRLHHIARTQRPRWVLPRPELELHGLLRQRRRRTRSSRQQSRPPVLQPAAPEFRSSSVSLSPPSFPRRASPHCRV